MNTPQSNETPRVYSYIRYSTKEQSLGESERRQIFRAKAYAEKHSMQFDDALRMFDRGVSAFKGDNVKAGGALGGFLSEIKAGRVPSGSVLVVENIDRITRQGFLDAFAIVADILKANIKIHTTSPEETYDRAAAESGRIYALVGQIQMAHAESKKKSERIKYSWVAARKRMDAEKTTNSLRCPKWLRPVRGSDGIIRHEVIPAARAAIQEIFCLYLKGAGSAQICKRMNAGRYWRPPVVVKKGKPIPGPKDRWRASYIVRLLRNRELVGEMQCRELSGPGRRLIPIGEAIKEIYPIALNPATFERAQAKAVKNVGPGKGGRRGGNRNLFTGLVKCAYCGSSMLHQPKGENNYAILVCDAGRSGCGCKRAHACRYGEFQLAVLNNCAELRPEIILPSGDDQARKRNGLRTIIAETSAIVRKQHKEIDNLMDFIARHDDRDTQESAYKKIEARRIQLVAAEKELQGQQEQLRLAEMKNVAVEGWIKSLAKLKEMIRSDTEESDLMRSALREHLRSLIDKIEVFTHGFRSLPNDHTRTLVVAHPKAGADSTTGKAGDKKHRDYMVDMEKIKNSVPLPYSNEDLLGYCDAVLDEIPKLGFRTYRTRGGFMKYIEERANSRHGRFYRVHFKTGKVWDIVPPGSIAMGVRLRRDEKEPKFKFTPIGKLWTKYVRLPRRYFRKAA